MTSEVRPIRPGIEIQPVEPEEPSDIEEAWKAAMADCLSDGGLAGGAVVWRDKGGRVNYHEVGWDVLQVLGAMTIAGNIAHYSAGGRNVDGDDE